MAHKVVAKHGKNSHHNKSSKGHSDKAAQHLIHAHEAIKKGDHKKAEHHAKKSAQHAGKAHHVATKTGKKEDHKVAEIAKSYAKMAHEACHTPAALHTATKKIHNHLKTEAKKAATEIQNLENKAKTHFHMYNNNKHHENKHGNNHHNNHHTNTAACHLAKQADHQAKHVGEKVSGLLGETCEKLKTFCVYRGTAKVCNKAHRVCSESKEAAISLVETEETETADDFASMISHFIDGVLHGENR